MISLLFYQEKTEQEVGNMLHISHQAVNKRKQALLLKLRKIFEELF
ncbi:sigma factor-like helix-turn-helix DNA-binding protein [Peptostreptococcus sp. MV1]